MLKPQATATRELVSLDGLWLFALDTAVGEAPWQGTLATRLEAAVPSSYNDLFTDPAIRDHVGIAWYQRTVRVPRGWADERVVLRFGAATHAAAVYVDDTLVAEHVGGYTPFEADLTGVVKAGEEFRLTVGVDNRLTNTTIPPGTVTTDSDGRQSQSYLHDFFNYAGLARSVRLYSTPKYHIDDITITTDLSGAEGSIDGTVEYSVSTNSPADVRVRVLDEAAHPVAVGAGGTGRLHIEDVTPWQPGAAYLYDLVVEIVDDEKVVDTYTQPFSIRTVEVRGTEFLRRRRAARIRDRRARRQ
jgi:beta-glucuronidase